MKEKLENKREIEKVFKGKSNLVKKNCEGSAKQGIIKDSGGVCITSFKTLICQSPQLDEILTGEF